MSLRDRIRDELQFFKWFVTEAPITFWLMLAFCGVIAIYESCK